MVVSWDRVQGSKWHVEALQHEQLLTPLAMVDTQISLTAEELERFAAHYWPHERRVERQR
jgi:hypothetical protein